MPKITLIGAGSFGFGRRLLADVLSFPELSESRISLMDIDEQKLALVEALTNKLLRDTGVGATIEVTSDRKSALDGADYVLTTIRVGDDYDLDKGIPLKYGHFGYFVTESTRHMSEYVPYFRKRRDIMEKFSLQPSSSTSPKRR